MMTWEQFQSNLGEVNQLRAEVRRRSMIFNCVGKEHAAKFYGLPIDAFYDLPFAQWVDVDHHYYRALQALDGSHPNAAINTGCCCAPDKREAICIDHGTEEEGKLS